VVDVGKKVATRIKTTIALVAPNLVFEVGRHYRFTIVNPDGEKACLESAKR